MANQDMIQTRLQLFFVTGVDADGENIIKAKAFNNIKPEATPAVLLSASQLLTSLQQHGLSEIKRNDTSLITEA